MNLLSDLKNQNKDDRDREFRKSVSEAARIARMYYQAERERRELVVPMEWARVLAKTVKTYSN